MSIINLKPPRSRTTRPNPADLPDWTPNGPGDQRLLRLLWHYGYLTRELAEYYVAQRLGGSGGHVRNRLTRLWKYGYVQRFYRGTPPGGGSSQYVYALTREGARLVLTDEHFRSSTADPLTPTELKLKNLNKRKVNYEHTLATVIWRMVWELGIREVPELEHRAYWMDKEGDGSGEPRSSKNAFSVLVDGQRVPIYPDATIWLAWKPSAAHRGYFQPLFIEIERSHRNAGRSRTRFLAYEALLTTGHDQVIDACRQHVDPRITPERGIALFVGVDSDHRDRLRRAARTALTRSNLPMVFASFGELFENGDGEQALLTKPMSLFVRPIAVHLKGTADQGNPWSIVPERA